MPTEPPGLVRMGQEHSVQMKIAEAVIEGNDAVRAKYGCTLVGPKSETARIDRLDVTLAEGDAFEFAGGPKLATPFGDFYAPNITSSKDFGLGNWTLSEFEA